MIVEIKALVLSNSPFVTEAYGAFYKNGRIILPIEFIDYGSLKDLLTKLGRIHESILGLILY